VFVQAYLGVFCSVALCLLKFLFVFACLGMFGCVRVQVFVRVCMCLYEFVHVCVRFAFL